MMSSEVSAPSMNWPKNSPFIMCSAVAVHRFAHSVRNLALRAIAHAPTWYSSGMPSNVPITRMGVLRSKVGEDSVPTSGSKLRHEYPARGH